MGFARRFNCGGGGVGWWCWIALLLGMIAVGRMGRRALRGRRITIGGMLS